MTVTEQKEVDALLEKLIEERRTSTDRLEIVREFVACFDANAAIIPNREPGRDRLCKLIDRARIAAGQRKRPGTERDNEATETPDAVPG